MKYYLIITGLLISIATLTLGANNYHIEQSDFFFTSRDVKGHLTQAISFARDGISRADNTTEQFTAHWRLARALSESIDYQSDSSKEELLKNLSEAKLNATKAISLFPNKVEGHYWKAIAVGREAELKGIMKSLKSVKPIKNAMNKVLEINPDFHRAYFVLSRLHRKAPKIISIGNPKKSLTYINKALNLDNKESRYLLEKAEVLIKLKRKEKAKQVLQQLENLPYHAGYFKSTIDKDKQTGRRLRLSLK